MSTALRSVGLLDVPSSTSPGPSVARLVSTPVSTASRRTLVRNAGYPPEERPAAGRAAEESVCRYLSERGWEIVARNVRGGKGEVDIVAREGGLLAFVEVRYRGRGDFGRPEESIDRSKRLRIVSASRGYLAAVSPASWKEIRFDVAAVEDGPDGPVIRYYPGAFDARGNLL